MNKKSIFFAAALALAAACAAQNAAAGKPLDSDAFPFDGKPVHIRCGDLAYARIPRAYWRHRLAMCRALGLNTVYATMFWNYHEPERGKFDFSGEKDVAAFCRAAKREGLWVILRLGPYPCGEWEFGGRPWWLLDKGAEKVRPGTTDPAFLEPAKAYARRVAEELVDLQATHGGPIIMVQDESAAPGADREYLRVLYDEMRAAGFDVPFHPCSNGANSPAGFFSLYKVHRGTPFGWWGNTGPAGYAGASCDDAGWAVSEQGRPTPEFGRTLELVKASMTEEEIAEIPVPTNPPPVVSFESDVEGELVVPAKHGIFDLLEKHERPLPMEMLGQGFGEIAYGVQLDSDKGGILKAPNIRDQAVVLDNQKMKFLGFLDARHPDRGVTVPEGTRIVAILVTHWGRCDSGSAPESAAKGLLPPVTLDGKELKWWVAFSFGPDIGFVRPGELYRKCVPPDTPSVFKRFKVEVPSPADTFLLTRGWKKGHVWVNGHPLGRFAGTGPRQTLFVPGCWLKEGENEFIVFDFGGNVPMKGLKFVDAPVCGEMHPEDDIMAGPAGTGCPKQGGV